MSYSVLANYYDSLMSDFDYDAYYNFILDNVKGQNGLDLASGSGEMTIRLSRAGYKMVGSDISTEMLTRATEKSKKSMQNILFVVADLNNLTISKKYDFVTSVCDGFNYISSINNIELAFLQIYNSLKSGGKFIFDISSKYKLQEIIGDNLFYEDDENLTYFWQNQLFDNRVEMELTFFERQGDKYIRYDDEQTQYFYDNNKIISLLQKTGFNVKTYNENFKELTTDSQRLVVVATK